MKNFTEIGTSKSSNQLKISLIEIPIEFLPRSTLNELYKSYLFPPESWYNSFNIWGNTIVDFKAKCPTKLHWTMNDGAYTVYACHDLSDWLYDIVNQHTLSYLRLWCFVLDIVVKLTNMVYIMCVCTKLKKQGIHLGMNLL